MINYFSDENIDDWRILALSYLEKDICNYSKKHKIHGIDKEDVSQELRLYVWENFYKYNSDRGSIRTWFYNLIRGKYSNMIKIEKRRYIRSLIFSANCTNNNVSIDDVLYIY